jgi:hypothetical protein
MKNSQPNESRGNYFALPRLIRKLRGGNATRSEGNWLEACVIGAIVYLISYLFTASLLLPKLNWWQIAIALPLLFFGLWIGWLIVLYVHSLIAKACESVGLCADLPRRRVQSVLMGILTTIFAAQLLTAGPVLRVIGALWIAAVALNLAAALLLALFHDEPAQI